jgi:hypothetical protein
LPGVFFLRWIGIDAGQAYLAAVLEEEKVYSGEQKK